MKDLSLKSIVVYMGIVFFVLIIVISFGMPDFLSRMGGNPNMVAVVNGKNIDRLDFVRFRDTMSRNLNLKSLNDKDASRIVLSAVIEHTLLIQKAVKLGITVSDDRVRSTIKSIPIFKNSLGSFDNEQYKRYLNHYHFSKSEYFFYVRENLVNGEFYDLLESGIAVSPDEVISENAIESSQVQIQYAYISDLTMKALFRNEATVSDAEVAAELKKASGAAGKDGSAFLRARLENRKFNDLKGKIMTQIDGFARIGKPFAEVVRQFGGIVAVSKVFKIGENIREEATIDKHLAELAGDRVFAEDCLMLEPGRTSRAIPATDGIMVFTPVKKEISFKEPDPANYAEIYKKLLKERMNAVYASMIGSFKQKSRITINPKFSEN